MYTKAHVFFLDTLYLWRVNFTIFIWVITITQLITETYACLGRVILASYWGRVYRDTYTYIFTCVSLAVESGHLSFLPLRESKSLFRVRLVDQTARWDYNRLLIIGKNNELIIMWHHAQSTMIKYATKLALIGYQDRATWLGDIIQHW